MDRSGPKLFFYCEEYLRPFMLQPHIGHTHSHWPESEGLTRKGQLSWTAVFNPLSYRQPNCSIVIPLKKWSGQ